MTGEGPGAFVGWRAGLAGDKGGLSSPALQPWGRSAWWGWAGMRLGGSRGKATCVCPSDLHMALMLGGSNPVRRLRCQGAPCNIYGANRCTVRSHYTANIGCVSVKNKDKAAVGQEGA